jgi:DNA-3-methyladenine glycosylase II
VASAAAIWRRVEAAVQPFTAKRVLAMSEAELRAAGLSRPKVRTLLAAAEAVAAGRLDMAALATVSDETVHERLTAVKGVGPWTADIFIMFCLGRADSFAAGDLALQEAVRMALALDDRPGRDELADIAERWRPWRAVAALMLWEYYRVAKSVRQAEPA